MLQRKILIVEDNELNRALLGNILEENYEILEAETGRSHWMCWRTTGTTLR